MTTRQRYPTNDAEAIVSRLRGVDIAGGGSTIGRDDDRLTVGAESRARAVASALGKGATSSMADVFERWRRQHQRMEQAQSRLGKSAER
jgi:hypothetical protein